MISVLVSVIVKADHHHHHHHIFFNKMPTKRNKYAMAKISHI